MKWNSEVKCSLNKGYIEKCKSMRGLLAYADVFWLAGCEMFPSVGCPLSYMLNYLQIDQPYALTTKICVS